MDDGYRSKIGLSVSLCISDIAAGHVDEEDVAFIMGGTAAKDPESLIAYYSTYYWHDKEKCADVLIRFWNEGRIIQSRLFVPERNMDVHNIARGHWLIRHEGQWRQSFCPDRLVE